MKDRIKKLMESQHMTQQVFAKFLGISPATLSSIFCDRTKPTITIVEAIKIAFPDVNTDWVMFGIGEMFTSPKQESGDSENPTSSDYTPVGDSAEASLFPENNLSEPALNFAASAFSHSDLVAVESQRRNSGGNAHQRSTRQEHQREEAKIVERQPRKVIEIRVYYDDLTYETFSPSKK